jgi:hypothetical protein
MNYYYYDDYEEKEQEERRRQAEQIQRQHEEEMRKKMNEEIIKKKTQIAQKYWRHYYDKYSKDQITIVHFKKNAGEAMCREQDLETLFKK